MYYLYPIKHAYNLLPCNWLTWCWKFKGSICYAWYLHILPFYFVQQYFSVVMVISTLYSVKLWARSDCFRFLQTLWDFSIKRKFYIFLITSVKFYSRKVHRLETIKENMITINVAYFWDKMCSFFCCSHVL